MRTRYSRTDADDLSQPKPKAVIYTRVSSRMQAECGQGAESQEAYCREYARMKGYEVIRVFTDKDVSGKILERPCLKQMLAFLRKNRALGLRVIIDDVSRLARHVLNHLLLRDAIASAGGTLVSTTGEPIQAIAANVRYQVSADDRGL